MSNQNAKLSLNYVFREPSQRAENRKPPLLLLLHGIGSNEQDLFGLTPYLDERFFIASAQAPIALDSQAFAWFELSFTLQGMTANLAQAETSRQTLIKFIAELIEKHDLEANQVYLCGFSQGAIMSYAVMFSAAEKLAGVVAMSGRTMSKDLLQNVDANILKEFPVLIVHGKHDNVLTINDARESRDLMEKFGVALEYHEYEMAHQVSNESLADVSDWLRKRLDVMNH